MKSLIPFFIAVTLILGSLSLNGFSQCTVAIPNDAHIFDTSKTVSASGADIIGSNWICAGDTLVITSGFGSQTFFLEEGAVLFGGGGGSRTVYLKPGALFDCGGGGGQIIYYDDSTTYTNCGSVYPTYCAPLTFDYTNAPSGGCSFGTSVYQISSALDLEIYPNPADDYVLIDFTRESQDARILLLDISGRIVIDAEVKEFPVSINTAKYPDGIYLIMLMNHHVLSGMKKLMIAR